MAYFLPGYLKCLIFKSTLAVRVQVEVRTIPNMQKVNDQIFQNLSKTMKIIPCDQENSDVNVVFCPIVSRAGTDLEATLGRLSDMKPNIVMVLHHTFSNECVIPKSSSYERKNLMMVDLLYHEDQGLLDCSENNGELTKVVSHLKKYAKPQYTVRTPFRIAGLISDIMAFFRAFLNWISSDYSNKHNVYYLLPLLVLGFYVIRRITRKD